MIKRPTKALSTIWSFGTLASAEICVSRGLRAAAGSLGPVPSRSDLGFAVNLAEPWLYDGRRMWSENQQPYKMPSQPGMKAGCPWECNNFFVAGTISLCQAHPSWVSTSLTQFALSLCLPSPPGEWEPLFPGPARMPLLWSFLSPRLAASWALLPVLGIRPVFQQGRLYPASTQSPLLGRGQCRPGLHLTHFCGTVQVTRWHPGCVCSPTIELSIWEHGCPSDFGLLRCGSRPLGATGAPSWHFPELGMSFSLLSPTSSCSFSWLSCPHGLFILTSAEGFYCSLNGHPVRFL